MLVPITPRMRLRVSRPLWLEIEHTPQLELVLPPDVRDILVPPVPLGYHLRVYESNDSEALANLFRHAGFALNTDDVDAALSLCLPRGCFVVEHDATGTIIASMMARHLASRSHPFGGRIDWLATDPNHRNRGLGAICARCATRRLIEAGYEHIWVTTDDHRLGALKVFVAIGFKPVIEGADGDTRWRQVFASLNG